MSRKPEKDKNQNIQVSVRLRPLNTSEKKKGAYSVVETGEREVNVRERNSATAPVKTFNFDHVYGYNSKQIEIYRQVVSPLVEEVLMGYNCTVFAYGQTSTGKTFTMEGEKTENANMSWEEDPLAGIIPRAMNQLFTRLSKMGCEFSVRVSFLEIYNEDLIDLLGAESVDNPRLKIYEDATRKGSCVIQGLEEVVVQDKNEVYKIMDRGSARRQTAATLMNAHSSRSHSLFMVTIHIKENSVDGEELLKTGKLNLVDLAGSECVGRSGAVDKRAREAGNINQSLLTLGRVITALVEHTPHVPYRESKLTRLLQDSLGGRTKTSIIATISPASINLDETLSTLDYAFRAKNIMNRPEVNQKLTKKALLKEYNEEIERLRRDLQAARDKNGVYLAQENYDDMQTKIQQQRDSINELTDRINATVTEMLKITDMFHQTKEDLADTKQFLEETQQDLADTKTTLEKTRLNLQVTVQDRDEQKHIVSRQVITETKLSGQATQLLHTADEATADVAGLHDKLSRTKSVETHNENMKETFMGEFSANVKDMKESLMAMKNQQSNTSSSIVNTLALLTEQRTTEVETVCTDLQSLIKNMKSHQKTMEEGENAQAEKSNVWSDNVASYCSQTQDEELSRRREFQENTLLASLTEIQLSLARHNVALDQMTDMVTHQLADQQASINSYQKAMAERLAMLDELARTVVLDMNATISKQKEDLQKITTTQESLNKDLAEELVTKVNDLVQSMVGKQLSSLAGNVDNAQMQNTDMGKRVKVFSTEMAESLASGKSCNDEKRDGLLAQAKSHHCALEGNVVKLQENIAEVQANEEKLKSDMSTFSSETIEIYKKRTAHLLELQKQHMDALNSAREGRSQNAVILSGNIEKEVDRLTSQQCDQMTSSTSTLVAQQSALQTSTSDLRQWTEAREETLDKRVDEVNCFISNELKVDNPTGLTPQRRDFSYPSKLTRTDRHTLLLQHFRRDYVLQDVTDLPIPDTSFGSQMDDAVTPLSFDEAESAADDAPANLSADSAISSNSLVSSISDLEDTNSVKRSRSRDNKENQMKPPASKGAPRPKATEIRSRSRSSSRTPKKTTPASTPRGKNPLTSSNNLNKGKTNIPLRSNNP